VGLPGDESTLLRAVISLSRHLGLGEVLQQLVTTAAELTGAPCAAINVLDGRGVANTFLTYGASGRVLNQLQKLAQADQVLASIPGHEVLTMGHPPPGTLPLPPGQPLLIGPILAVSVRVRHMVFAHLFLVNKPGGFVSLDTEVAAALATAAGAAIENAQLYEAAKRRENWLAAGTEITTMLLSGADEEQALSTIARRAREVAGACAAVLILPSVGGQLVMEIADGDDAEDLVGTRLPPNGRAQTVLTEGIGMIVDSLATAYTLRLAKLRSYGPALFAPMRTSGRGVGVMLLLRQPGDASFNQADLATAESFASQAALALVLSEARHASDYNSLVDERERIARDLHDLAIQQLFATGMHIETARQHASVGDEPAGLEKLLANALDSIDDTVKEIRSIVSHLRHPGTDEPLDDRLRHEASLARTLLGFAPSLVLLLDGEAVVAGAANATARTEALCQLVGASLADDVVAVAREGLSNAARHAKASSVSVTVSVVETVAAGPGRVSVMVDDDGQGIPAQRQRSSGLANLARRAAMRQGLFEAASRPEGGSHIEWSAPLT